MAIIQGDWHNARFRIGLVCAILWGSDVIDLSPAFSADAFDRKRARMVQQHVESAGIIDPRVLESMRTTPRHEFMPPHNRNLAYFDMAVPIGHGQTISPPYIVAFMTEQLDPQPTDRVLEIGTGSGYQAAVLSPLVEEVYTIEIVEPLGIKAERALRRLNYANVFTKIGDGFAGWPEHAPFDKIIVTCSPENIPRPLIQQLADGGQIIVPVGERFQQTLCRFRKIDGQLKREPLQATFFVPMTGTAEAQRKVKPDPARPAIAHGSFEQRLGESTEPDGWYYVREGKVETDPRAPQGKQVLSFENHVQGRSAHALQAVGVDGLVVREVEIELWTQGTNIRRAADQSARLVVEFYSENRAAIGHQVLGPWSGSFRWTKRKGRIKIPTNTRLAVIGIGLFGATGQLSIDDVKLKVVE